MKSYVASHLKDMNRHVVYNLINELETTSKAQISKMTGISAPTVIKIVTFLVDSGLVLELGEGESIIGRKPHMLTLNRDKLYSAVFFLEGEMLHIGIADIVGDVKHKKHLRCEPDLDSILGRISSGLVEGLFAEIGIGLEKLMGIGIAIPGIYDIASQTVMTAPLIGVHKPVCIEDRVREMEQKYGVRVIVENDVNCQCYGEFKAAKMPEDADLLLISIGTGFGAGLILNGKLRHGVTYMCGEIGYMTFMSDYAPSLGKPGWMENQIGIRALEDKFGITYEADSLSEDVKKAASEYISGPLALCICNITMLLDCPNVRLSGLVLDLLGDELVNDVNEKLKHICLNDIKVQKQHRDDIGLTGMAAMLIEKRISEILLEK